VPAVAVRPGANPGILRRVPAERSDAPIEPARGAQPYSILIVDDEEGILESLELTLADEYRVFTARTGQEGLAILAREPIALVIADQVLPGMTGVEFLEKVIERNPTAIRIMLTGYADLASIVRAVNEGRIYRYIAKPWDPDELRLNVKRALESYGLATENVQLAAALARPTSGCGPRTCTCAARWSAATPSRA
jgi:DNA-binding NtrC family response regulator